METGTTSLELQVQIISKETVKPSSATPPHLRNFTLSVLDQLSAPLHIPALLFYTPSCQTRPLDITCLRTALSEALTRFYPLAGRCQDESTIICNDEGVPFVEARVNCALSDVMNSSCKLDLLSKFQLLPPKDLLATGKQQMSELVQLAFQVNVFDCGGVVIGFYMLHKIMDGSSLGVFFRHWAAFASGSNCDDLVQPDFDSTVTAFPPYQPEPKEPEQSEQANMPDYYNAQGKDRLKIVGKGFIFTDVSVSKLKAKAASTLVPNPTRFETALGFIWEKALAAEATVTDAHSEFPVLLFAADMRKRVSLPVTEGSIGNLTTSAIAFAEKGCFLPELVAHIHGAVMKVKDEIVEFQGENGAVALLDQRKKLGNYLAGYKPGTYFVSSWSRNGLSEVDFGFGKPRWIVFPVCDGKIVPPYRNFVSLTDYSDAGGDGITAWIYLEEKEMQVLENNQEFLAFASQW